MNDVTIVMLAGILSGMIIGATLMFVIFAPKILVLEKENYRFCLLYTSPSPRD